MILRNIVSYDQFSDFEYLFQIPKAYNEGDCKYFLSDPELKKKQAFILAQIE